MYTSIISKYQKRVKGDKKGDYSIIEKEVSNMSEQQAKDLLVELIIATNNLDAAPIGIEVRLCKVITRSCSYDVVLKYQDGSETIVDFPDRRSRLMYIYTLLNPQGFKRSKLEKDPQPLIDLYDEIFIGGSKEILRNALTTNFERIFIQAVCQSRVPFKKLHAEIFSIAQPTEYFGKTIIPYISGGEHVEIDPGLQAKFNWILGNNWIRA